MSKLEREFEKTQNKVGLKMKLLDTDKDGVIHIDEVLQAATLIAGANNEDVIKQVRMLYNLVFVRCVVLDRCCWRCSWRSLTAGFGATR
mmetsp:Transcript_14312/g.57819  ORF Transcript_14312/g.57819 Transcript_14312/m.57819 type:complete len:89 (-) Transcript_14312:2656-2922(-)